jgi:hypothetical protein
MFRSVVRNTGFYRTGIVDPYSKPNITPPIGYKVAEKYRYDNTPFDNLTDGIYYAVEKSNTTTVYTIKVSQKESCTNNTCFTMIKQENDSNMFGWKDSTVTQLNENYILLEKTSGGKSRKSRKQKRRRVRKSRRNRRRYPFHT